MTVKAIYEGGVLKPKRPLALHEREEVEIEIMRAGDAAVDDDPRTFVGFIKDAPEGVPLARDHDDHLDE